MHSVLRADDTMARVGGDEFIILLENTTTSGVREVAQKLCSVLAGPMEMNQEPLYISLSLGISMYPCDGEDVDTLVRNADAAMYKAKASGRDNFQFYTPDMTDEAVEQAFLQNHLRRAIDQQEFCLHYQPQVDIRNGRVVGVEALLRWAHPTEGMIMPLRFIPLLEEQGLIRQVGPWVLHQACVDWLDWQRRGIAPGSIAVNLSGTQINTEGAVEEISRILEETGMPAGRLELEVTETFVMRDPESNINALHRLRELGIHLAIDDFGTGYSSLAYLKRLPINKLKIDRSFIRDVPGDSDDEAITRAVVGLGRSLNLEITAEGVEDEACVQFLLREGCHTGQGYLWAKPMPANELEHWLKTNGVE
jgi:EAL domain-containing protein (putative c-di-GMP-specific phosphodiesterase class I)